MFVVNTAVHGYSVYQAVWEPYVGEGFVVLQETSMIRALWQSTVATKILVLLWGIYYHGPSAKNVPQND